MSVGSCHIPAHVVSRSALLVRPELQGLFRGSLRSLMDILHTADLAGTAYLCAFLCVRCLRLQQQQQQPLAGAMNGLFSKLSMSEIRSRSGLCAAAACTKPCQRVRAECLCRCVVEKAVCMRTPIEWSCRLTWRSRRADCRMLTSLAKTVSPQWETCCS